MNDRPPSLPLAKPYSKTSKCPPNDDSFDKWFALNGFESQDKTVNPFSLALSSSRTPNARTSLQPPQGPFQFQPEKVEEPTIVTTKDNTVTLLFLAPKPPQIKCPFCTRVLSNTDSKSGLIVHVENVHRLLTKTTVKCRTCHTTFHGKGAMRKAAKHHRRVHGLLNETAAPVQQHKPARAASNLKRTRLEMEAAAPSCSAKSPPGKRQHVELQPPQVTPLSTPSTPSPSHRCSPADRTSLAKEVITPPSTPTDSRSSPADRTSPAEEVDSNPTSASSVTPDKPSTAEATPPSAPPSIATDLDQSLERLRILQRELNDLMASPVKTPSERTTAVQLVTPPAVPARQETRKRLRADSEHSPQPLTATDTSTRTNDAYRRPIDSPSQIACNTVPTEEDPADTWLQAVLFGKNQGLSEAEVEFATLLLEMDSIQDPMERWANLEDKIIPQLTRKAGGRLKSSNSAQQRPKEPAIPKRRTCTAYAKEASEAQRLFNANPRQAVEKILNSPSANCKIGSNRLEQHFKESFSMQSSPTPDELFAIASQWIDLPAPDLHFSLEDFTPAEVVEALSHHADTAPGDDRLLYSGLRTLDPRGFILAAIFNQCKSMRRIPKAWKSSTLHLIHKKGDTDDIRNWRPIALSSTLYKTYTRLWATRLTAHITSTNLLSSAQKGFLPGDGCGEHIWVADAVLHQATPGTTMTWLDLRDAFGSVPHPLIHATLRLHHLPEHFIDIVKDMYDGATCRVRTHTDDGLVQTTGDIPVKRGVKQGDPLSPLLFNLALEPLTRMAIQQERPVSCLGENLSALAYADDVLLFSASPDSMQKLLSDADHLLTRMGLSINPQKCGTLTIDKGRKCKPHQFHLNDNSEAIPTLHKGDFYRYLGKSMGFEIQRTPIETCKQIIQDSYKIGRSKLSGFQKLKAIKTFILPRLSYILRVDPSIPLWALKEVDIAITSVTRGFLHLPVRSSRHYLQGDTNTGCLGVLLPSTEKDIQNVVQAFRILTCPDTKVASMAWKQLLEEVTCRMRIPHGQSPTAENLSKFLSGMFDDLSTCEGTRLQHSRGGPTLWREAAYSCKRLKKTVSPSFVIEEGFTVKLFITSPTAGSIHADQSERKHIFRAIRKAVLHAHSKALRDDFPSQGAAFRSIAKDPASSNFLRNGQNISHASFTWVHAARLNLLTLNGQPGIRHVHRKKAGRQQSGTVASEDLCRRCNTQGAPETLSHVLCNCPAHLAKSISARHNLVTKEIHRALTTALVDNLNTPNSKWEVAVDQPLNCAGRNLRPDLVAINTMDKKAVILDIVCPFERDENSFLSARNHKRNKYALEAEALRRQNFNVILDAVVVGPLGSWDPENDWALKACGLSANTLWSLKQKCVSCVLDVSRTQYWEHIMGDRYVHYGMFHRAAGSLRYLSGNIPSSPSNQPPRRHRELASTHQPRPAKEQRPTPLLSRAEVQLLNQFPRAEDRRDYIPLGISSQRYCPPAQARPHTRPRAQDTAQVVSKAEYRPHSTPLKNQQSNRSLSSERCIPQRTRIARAKAAPDNSGYSEISDTPLESFESPCRSNQARLPDSFRPFGLTFRPRRRPHFETHLLSPFPQLPDQEFR